VESVDAPLHTVAASPKDQNQFLTAHLVKLRGDNVGSDAREPLHTVSAQGTHHAVTACFLAQHNGGFNTTPGHDAREPLPTIASTGSQQQLVGASLIPYYGSEADRAGAGVGEPARTVTTRDRFGLVEVFGGCPHLTPEMEAGARRVAAFLRAHGVEFAGEFAAVAGGFVIVDIGMRMLRPRELYRAQGFPENYIIDRGLDRDTKTGRLAQIKLTKTAQVRMCGNSVCPPMAEALVRANLPDMIEEEAAA
jgi:DNA (cytosine-5)-methyltransferase 1